MIIARFKYRGCLTLSNMSEILKNHSKGDKIF